MLYIVCLLIFTLTAYYLGKILKIKSTPVRLIYYEIIFNCFIKFLQGYLNFPSILNYLTDLILCIIVFYYCMERINGVKSRVPSSLIIVFVSYVMVTISSYVLNIYSPLLYIWGFRNNMRFIIFSMMCVAYLKKEDIFRIFDMLFGYFLLNIIAVIYEFFFAGLTFHTGDLISGLYSVKTSLGGNDSLNWLICFICTNAIVQYLNKTKNFSYLLVCLLGSLYMASMSELKIFFVEIVCISVIAIWMCKKSMRMVIFIFSGAIAIFFAVNLLYIYFPQFANFFDLTNLQSIFITSEGYGGSGSVSRSGAMSYVFNNFLKLWPDKMLGVGFGNADYSSFTLLTSEFYRNNFRTAYQWFYGPFILTETGILGLMAYIAILLNFMKQSVQLKGISVEVSSLKTIAVIMTGLSIGMLFYNQSMKVESSGYLVFFLLSIPYIVKRSSRHDTI